MITFPRNVVSTKLETKRRYGLAPKLVDYLAIGTMPVVLKHERWKHGEDSSLPFGMTKSKSMTQ